ncbi:VWA domain-containing protein [Candidatus Wolfebacteria bacterium]|nr:VWA domain-containing protein [Candidatus Wolfebacteria bacterium]
MEKLFEKLYQAETSKTREQVISEKVSEIEKKYGKPIGEVIKEREETLGLIAKMVGKDFGMNVSFGEAGGGSYFVPEDKTIPKEKWNNITLDPMILLEFEGADEFVAAHEGAHRAITKTMEQVALKPKEEREKYAEKIGWGFIHNALEDPVVNNWVGGLYQRTAKILDENYEQQFKKEGAVMSTPQVQSLMDTLGYVPNFVKYGSEVMRYWHKKEYSKDLPEKVKEALKNTRRIAESFYSEVPYTYPTEKDVLLKSKNRWQIYEKGIWPQVQKLIEEDLIDEKLKQYLKDQLKKAMEQMGKDNQEQGEKQKEQQQKEKSGDQKGQEQKNSEQQEGQSGNQKEQQKDGNQQGEQGQQGQEGGQESERQGNQSGKSQAGKTEKMKQQTGEGEGENLEDIMKQFGFDEKEKQEMCDKMKEAAERQKNNQEKLKEKLKNGEISQEEFDKEMEESQGNIPMDMKSMSESAKKKIEEKLKTESKEAQEQMEKAAQESLEKAEDEVNKSIEGKIGPKEEMHQERQERQEKESEEAKKQVQEIAEKLEKQKKEQEKFEEWQKEREGKRNAWEKAVSEQAKTIDELYQLIEEFFQKKKHLRWQKGFSAGGRLDLGAAMQYEADPRNYTRLWEKKIVPEKYDYRFSLLNDQSGSMREGNKAENDLIAKAMVTEVLAGLGIPCEILGFTTSYENNVKKYKSFNEDLNEERERLMKELSKIVSDGGGYTPTYTATEIASESLALERQNTKNHAHFLIVISDGNPYNDPQDSSIEGLKELNERLSKENEQVIIGMGIGNGINEENLKMAYGDDKYVYAENPEEFPKKMAALLEAIFTQSQGIR